jgi:hypothetical protein
VEEFLRNQGILENSLELSGNLMYSGAFRQLRLPSAKGEESGSNDEEFGQCPGFLGKCLIMKANPLRR